MRIASPLEVRRDQNTLEKLMREALQCAREGLEAGELPIGTVVANGDGEIIGRRVRAI